MRAIGLLAVGIALSPLAGEAQSRGGVDLTGRWMLTVTSEGQTAGSEVTLVQRGDSLIGKYSSQTLGDLEVVGSVKGRDFSFAYSASFNGQPLSVNVKGTVQAPDSLTGTATMGPLGAASFYARRLRGEPRSRGPR